MCSFKLPIEYSAGCRDLAPHIVADLEITESQSDAPSTYEAITGIKQSGHLSLAQKFTTDYKFLKDTQRLLRALAKTELSYTDDADMAAVWQDARHTAGFKERHHYVDFTPFEWLNRDAVWLQWISVYQLIAPILSLIVPFIIVLMPLLIIWSAGHPLSQYWEILGRLAHTHSLGRLLTQFSSVSWEQRIGLVLSSAFYLFGTYQNMVFCQQFVKIHQNMYASLRVVERFCRATVARMDTVFGAISKAKASTYAPWITETTNQRRVIVELAEQIDELMSCDSGMFKTVGQMGRVAKIFYDLHEDPDIETAINWSFAFNSYARCASAMSSALKNGRITAAVLSNKRPTEMRGLAYPPLFDSAIRNDMSFDKGSLVITGPNASGKTTTIKAAILNVILTQQWGCGTYRAATMRLYAQIHCYMNIPDTSGRDSLFQAEARRCKQILDAIDSSCGEAHFCVFDELYSGTNPEEATACSVKFIEYLQHKVVDCVFTTHFLGICEAKGVQCFGMVNYDMRPGVSRVRGGVKVLRDMGYPEEAIPKAFGSDEITSPSM